MSGNIAFPYHFDARGRTATTDDDTHLRDLIEQVLMTCASERVNIPSFGCGVPQLLFGAASDTVAATAQFLIQGALQRWMAPKLLLQDLTVTAQDDALVIDITYLNRLTQEQRTASFSSPVPSP
ncbi:GPW/gp25 family protein [Dyella silvae]|uniref:GPW/gp25 family protein n=1 Tax=Dyella silvae TaxID=2994424 RepID=UPI002264D10A|nr:GPW/gp25 family protein [Dyella silvae]